MSDPIQHILHTENFMPGWDIWPVDHSHRQAQLTRGFNLGIGAFSARVFRQNTVNLKPLHQGFVIRRGKRPARDDDVVVRKRRGRGWRIDKAQQVEMLRIGREFGQMHPSNGQHHAPGGALQCGTGCGDIRHALPAITGNWRPWCAGQRDQRHASLGTGGNGISAHLRGKRMGGIDNMCDPLILKVTDQTLHPPKPPDPTVNRLTHRAFHTTGERDHGAQPCLMHSTRQGRRLGRAAEDQKVGRDV